MRRFVLLFATLTLLAGSLSAQAPGYMGRRNILRIYSNFVPGFREYERPTPNPTYGPYIMHTEGLAYEHAASRRSTISFVVGMSHYGSAAERGNETGRWLWRPIGFGIENKMFPFLKRGFLAPIGPYYGLGILVFTGSTKWDATGPRAPINLGSSTSISMSLSTGWNALLSERLLLDVGVRFAVSPGVGSPNLYPTPNRALALAEGFKFHASLGYLFGK